MGYFAGNMQCTFPPGLLPNPYPLICTGSTRFPVLAGGTLGIFVGGLHEGNGHVTFPPLTITFTPAP
jgi:hypothetical protein